MADRIIDVYMVAAGMYHDIDYARAELLKLLAEHENVRTQVATDYHDLQAIAASDFLVSYTCNLVPSENEQIALRDYVTSGKRWIQSRIGQLAGGDRDRTLAVGANLSHETLRQHAVER